MEIIGKIKNIVAKTKNHLVFLEDKTMLSAFGSNKVLKEGKTYKFQCTKNGDFTNYDKKTVEEVSEDGPQPEVKEEVVKDVPRMTPDPICPIVPGEIPESTKTKESMERVKKHPAKLIGSAFGMLFNNTILLLMDQGRGKEIPKYFDAAFNELLTLHEKKRKELGVQ